MNSFFLHAVGNLARNPELVAGQDGSPVRTTFCLIGNDYLGKDQDDQPRETVTSVWFVAFGALAETIARHAKKGDQLIVQARVRSNRWIDKAGVEHFDHSFIVDGFRFGAPGRARRLDS